MSSQPTQPVQDSVQKVNDEVAVGSDLEFQRRWWRFERVIWVLFLTIVLLDALGFFGRGWAAKAHRWTRDGMMDVKYERIERYRTPSLLTIEFGPNAIHEGKVQLWASETLVKPLGNQRVVPQPASSVIGQGGILYTFPATTNPVSVEFSMEPSSPGIYPLALRVPGSEALTVRIIGMT
jgi:hypothetical protein